MLKTRRSYQNFSCATKRLHKELNDIQLNPPPFFSAKIVQNNILEWEATIRGPDKTAYANGVFRLSLKFPPTYPFDPPKVMFLTKIFHCNISYSGDICLDILHSTWSATMTVSTLLASIVSLLADPNPASPMVQYYGRLYEKNPDEYYRRVAEYTKKYASTT